MSVLGFDPDSFDVRLGSTVKYINLTVSGHGENRASFEDHQRAIDYISGRKDMLMEAIKALPAGVPSGPMLRKIIWDVLGIWLSVKKDIKLHFREGQNLTKYYVITEPTSSVPTGGQPSQDFEIKSRDGIIYTHVGISITFNSTAPYNEYKF